MSRNKPGLSLGQSGFVPGTNPGFLIFLHNGRPVFPGTNPACPWDNPGGEGQRKELTCSKFMCLFRSLLRGADSQLAREPVYEPYPGPRSSVDLASFSGKGRQIHIGGGWGEPVDRSAGEM